LLVLLEGELGTKVCQVLMGDGQDVSRR